MPHKTKEQLRSELEVLYAAHTLTDYIRPAVSVIRSHDAFRDAREVLAYAPMKDEIPCIGTLQKLAPEKEWYVPDVEAVAFISLRTAQEWRPGNGKTLLIVPARAADLQGNRLGRGGGWYDRFLARYAADVTSITVVPDFAVFDTIPVESHDVAIQHVLTASS